MILFDVQDIIDKFKRFNAEQLEPIVNFLEKELDVKINSKKSKSNEVITIIQMIEYLSDDSNYKEVDQLEIIDPDKKRNRDLKNILIFL
jgi:hypothetical protein